MNVANKALKKQCDTPKRMVLVQYIYEEEEQEEATQEQQIQKETG
jgi:hypothetical protein